MLAVLILLAAFLGRLEANRIRQILQGYLFFIGVLLSAMASTDMAFYSYFGDHANIMIFGVFDDDTSALLEIARKNYNLPLLLTGAIIYTLLLWLAITSLLPKKEPSKQRIHRPLSREYTLFLILILFSFLAGRGTFGHFPLYNDPIDVSGDPFVNILPQNGVYALVKSYKFYKESKEEK
jgi:glucan phosphoethanolaminetransferase (alkaline phosphatase superfamily)